ncbi:DUF423 domain-containing protein [Priestia megaterium]|uniref:DUF423 domain-containing protein n=1 Tax=Priestia TaxID=2800373 RepID=UPI001C8DACCC|nr:DUF423 domain-containing protein [Priestia aryabhattai]MBK0295481.1 DUF423 domain-containing protein [Bacillus sp. S34]MBY0029818.1 DUF423 domain-containing protein [Priestia aryabhattai]
MKRFFVIGIVNAIFCIILGAFGSHIIKNIVTPEMLTVWNTGVTYQMFQTIALILAGLFLYKIPSSRALKWSGWLSVIGILFFSGSLYLLSVTGLKVLGPITPLGGILFIIAWILLVIPLSKL